MAVLGRERCFDTQPDSTDSTATAINRVVAKGMLGADARVTARSQPASALREVCCATVVVMLAVLSAKIARYHM